MLRSLFLFSVLLLAQQNHAFNVESHSGFAYDLFKEVQVTRPKENVCLSPLSVQTCLALTYMGTEGDTTAQLRKGLHLEEFEKKSDVAADYAEFLTLATKQFDSKLQMSNRIYVDHQYDVLPEFNAIASNYFDSEAEEVNFAENEKTANTINAWVESATQHKIKNLIDASSLSGDTAAVLANAIYFKADWQYKFDDHLTIQRDFTLSDGVTSSVPTMYRSDLPVRYCEAPELDAVAVELAYNNTDLRMLILLPNKVDGIQELEQKLISPAFYDFQKNLEAEHVDLFLPKFKIEFGLSLVDSLKHLGMNALFDSHADFSSLLQTKNPFYISEVRHKVYIAVDEQGSEAAGATYAEASTRMARLNAKEVHVDHPFMFTITDKHNIYFLGHVVTL